MANPPVTHAPQGRFFILDWEPPQASWDTFEQAISLAKREHLKDPSKKLIVAQVVASCEPEITSKVTIHRT